MNTFEKHGNTEDSRYEDEFNKKEEEEDDNQEEKDQEYTHVDDYDTLIKMGFSDIAVKQALQQTGTYEAALQWCLDYPTGKTDLSNIKRQLSGEIRLRADIRKLILRGRRTDTMMTAEDQRTENALLYYAFPLLSKFEFELRRFLMNPEFKLHEKLQILASGKVKHGQFDNTNLRKYLDATQEQTRMIRTWLQSIGKDLQNLKETLATIKQDTIPRDKVDQKSTVKPDKPEKDEPEQDTKQEMAQISRKMDKVVSVICSIGTVGLTIGTGLICAPTLIAGIPLTLASFGVIGTNMVDDA